MALIERLTPGGNLYAAGSSTFSMLETLFRRMAEVRDVRDAELRTSITQGDQSLAEAITQGDNAERSAWQQADATVLDQAKADATTKANTAAADAQTAAVTTAVGQANTYTDEQVAAVQAGEVPDSRIDDGVDRALTDGRIDTAVNDTTVADLLGDPTSAAGTAVGDVIATRGPATLVPRTSEPVNVQDPKYGYVEGQDNTAAITAAWTDANNQTRGLFFPEGNYQYNGVGLSGPNPWIHGAGREKTRITLGATSRLFDTSVGLGTVDIGDFTINGGLGMFRTTRASNSVAGLYKVQNVIFKSYTGAAIEGNSVDMPYWKIRDCVFDGGNFTTTMGVALSGLTDGCAIEHCEFLRNRVHVKLRYGGNNAYVKQCDFLKFGANAGEPRVDVWVVPREGTSGNTGQGFVLDSCKFGPENLHPTDKRIVYAAEGPGSTNGDMFPVLNTVSSGTIAGHTVKDVLWGGISGATPPLVYSTTPEVRGCTYSAVTHGTLSEYVVEFLSPPPPSRLNSGNIVGPLTGNGLGVDGSPTPRASNAPGFAHLIDPQGQLAGSPGEVATYQGGDVIGYQSLARTPTAPYTASGSVTLASATDRLGGTDAQTATFTGAGAVRIQLVGAATTVRPGEPVWIEFDAKAGSFNSLRTVIEQSGGVYHFARVVRLGPNWHRYRLLWVPRTLEGGQYLRLEAPSAAGGTFTVGRVRVYQAQEPVGTDGLTVIGGTVYRLGVSGGTVTATAL